MKIRTGFVSNSSSSSFLIMGKWLDEEPTNLDKLEDNGLSYYGDEDSGPCIGFEIDIKESETWGEYKKRVAAEMTAAGFPINPDDVRICYGTHYC